MEAQELRKLRIAHGLIPSQLAELIAVSSQDLLCLEAPPGSPHHRPIDASTRRRILRQLALWRDRQKRQALLAEAYANPQRFTLQPFVPALATID